jgi:hypothetical protein
VDILVSPLGKVLRRGRRRDERRERTGRSGDQEVVAWDERRTRLFVDEVGEWVE